MRLAYLILIAILVCSFASAHQPKLGEDRILVDDPEVSKAYYGELVGEPHYYTIESDKEFDIYIGLLVPGDELTHTVSAELSDDSGVIEFLDGTSHEWTVWYEEFGGDYYMNGPELGSDFMSDSRLPAGTYTIKVFNKDNQGKYSLAVGDQEKFPFSEILNAVILVPWLKLNIFGSLNVLYIILLVFFFMLLNFIIGYFLRDNSIMDIAWGIGFVVIALFTLFMDGSFTALQIVLTLLVVVWGVRLSWHIFSRHKGEDFRYANWRKEWGKWVHVRAFFQVFMLQGFLMLLIALPIIVVNSYSYSRFGVLSVVGLLFWLFGFFFEAVGDYQLKQHLKKNKKIMTTGLWKYTRHPNYFGESVQWWGLGLMAVSVAWWVLLSPVLITFLLLKVSGIPMLEKRWDGNKEYQAYKKRTNAFFPWFHG